MIITLTYAPSVSQTVQKNIYTATTDLNIRSKAGATHPVLFTLNTGDKVEVLYSTGTWYKIDFSGQTGFAYSEYLKPISMSSENKSKTHNNMEVPETTIFNVIILVFLVVVAIKIYLKVKDSRLLKTVTTRKRGTKSERKTVLQLIKYGIPANQIFHDLYLKKKNADFSQIDIVTVTKEAVIVIEVKDYSGWIYGSGNQRNWTQVLAYGKQKYRFYNPIMQNRSHISELKKQLIDANHLPFYSIVLFHGKCEFKGINFIPNQTFLVKAHRLPEVLKNIPAKTIPIDDFDFKTTMQVLRNAVRNGDNLETQSWHRSNIRSMLGKHRIYD